MNKKLLPLIIMLSTVFGVSLTANADENDDSAAKIFPKQGELVQPMPESVDAYTAYKNPASLKNNYYFGVQLGWNVGASFTRTTTSAGAAQKDFSENASSPPVSLGLLFGNGGTYNGFYLGWEVAALVNYFKADDLFDSADSTSKTTYKMFYTVNVDFRPGYLVNENVLLFLCAGLSGNYLQVSPDSPSAATDKFSNILAGWRAGAGVDFFINDTFSIRGEFIHTGYFNDTRDYTNPTTSIKYSNKFSAKNNQVDLAFIMHF